MSVHGRVQRATLRLEIVGNSKQQLLTVKIFHISLDQTSIVDWNPAVFIIL